MRFPSLFFSALDRADKVGRSLHLGFSVLLNNDILLLLIDYTISILLFKSLTYSTFEANHTRAAQNITTKIVCG